MRFEMLFLRPKNVQRSRNRFIEVVLCKLKYCNNFVVKAAEIAERKFIRIGLIRMNLRSLAVDDLSELSQSKLD